MVPMKEIWTEKYRPKNLDEVVGQKHVTERLKAYVSSNNMPHLLLTGPAGTGNRLPGGYSGFGRRYR